MMKTLGVLGSLCNGKDGANNRVDNESPMYGVILNAAYDDMYALRELHTLAVQLRATIEIEGSRHPDSGVGFMHLDDLAKELENKIVGIAYEQTDQQWIPPRCTAFASLCERCKYYDCACCDSCDLLFSPPSPEGASCRCLERATEDELFDHKCKHYTPSEDGLNKKEQQGS